MQAHHHVMKIRGDFSAVSGGPDEAHALLAAFLEATGKLDRRALQKRVALGSEPIAVNLEALPALCEVQAAFLETDSALLEADPALVEAGPAGFEACPALLEAGANSLEASQAVTAPKSRIPSFAFRRANLVRA
jgi:hypothetical protein